MAQGEFPVIDRMEDLTEAERRYAEENAYALLRHAADAMERLPPGVRSVAVRAALAGALGVMMEETPGGNG